MVWTAGRWASAGHRLIERRRYGAAGQAFDDAAKAFEAEVGRDHIWTAYALSRQAWCYLQVGRSAEAVALSLEALTIVRNGRPDDQELISRFDALHKRAVARHQLPEEATTWLIP